MLCFMSQGQSGRLWYTGARRNVDRKSARRLLQRHGLSSQSICKDVIEYIHLMLVYFIVFICGDICVDFIKEEKNALDKDVAS